jgi:hypothetical protein
MLRTAQSLPPTRLSTLGSSPARFQAKLPACYRAPWQLPGPDLHRQATTSLRTRGPTLLTSQRHLLPYWAHSVEDPIRIRSPEDQEHPRARKSRPVMGCWGRGFAGWFPGGRVRGSSEWSHIHPSGACPGWAGAMTVPSGDRAAQSVLRARHGRLMDNRELARGPGDPSGSVTTFPVGSAGAVGA